MLFLLSRRLHAGDGSPQVVDLPLDILKPRIVPLCRSNTLPQHPVFGGLNRVDIARAEIKILLRKGEQRGNTVFENLSRLSKSLRVASLALVRASVSSYADWIRFSRLASVECKPVISFLNCASSSLRWSR